MVFLDELYYEDGSILFSWKWRFFGKLIKIVFDNVNVIN